MRRSGWTWLLAILLLLASLSSASAQERAAVCSLSWSRISSTFGVGSGWERDAPPIPLWITNEDTPDYQAQLFRSADGEQYALVVAEWGEPSSQELGPVVYCAIRDADGRTLEEIGTLPREAAPAEPPDDDTDDA
jgi:hypothetical protein